MADGQRSGKFRHVYGQPAKADKVFKDLKNPLTSGESRYVQCSPNFIAIPRSTGGGPVYILQNDKPGRVQANTAVLSVQKGKVLDTDFHPFIPNMIATSSEDCSVAVTKFPLEGLTESIKTADCLMMGHKKKVVLTQFNPTANSILATASFDKSIRLWNIETQSQIMAYESFKDNVYSCEWNLDGSMIAATSKDKKLHLFDPRIPNEASTVDAFGGAKSSKCFWLPNLGWIGAFGFSKSAKRTVKLWDLKDLSKPIKEEGIDQGSSILMPYYDNDLGILFSSGKGDGTVSWWEVINDNRKLYPLGSYRDTEPQKGGGWLPKRACDVFKCEVNRFYKLTSKSLIPISLIVPRKSGADIFQEDLYPNVYAGAPALSADEWLAGGNKDPITRSMDPGNQDDQVASVEFTKKKTYKELEDENAALKKENEELKAQFEDVGDGNRSRDTKIRPILGGIQITVEQTATIGLAYLDSKNQQRIITSHHVGKIATEVLQPSGGMENFIGMVIKVAPNYFNASVDVSKIDVLANISISNGSIYGNDGDYKIQSYEKWTKKGDIIKMEGMSSGTQYGEVIEPNQPFYYNGIIENAAIATYTCAAGDSGAPIIFVDPNDNNKIKFVGINGGDEYEWEGKMYSWFVPLGAFIGFMDPQQI